MDVFGLVMGHQTMLNPELEDHTGGDLGYFDSLCNRLFCFGQEPTPDIRNNIYFRCFGLAAFFGNQCLPEEGHQAEMSEINIVFNFWSIYMFGHIMLL